MIEILKTPLDVTGTQRLLFQTQTGLTALAWVLLNIPFRWSFLFKIKTWHQDRTSHMFVVQTVCASLFQFLKYFTLTEPNNFI